MLPLISASQTDFFRGLKVIFHNKEMMGEVKLDKEKEEHAEPNLVQDSQGTCPGLIINWDP